MPVYGVEQYIAKAIRSVLVQTYINWELIVVNDGTKDKSRDIAENFAKSDRRIRIIDKENGGLSDARNVGLKFASGEYIIFIDSDDWLEPDLLNNLVSYINDNKLDIAICGYFVDFIDNDGNLIEQNIRTTIPYKASSADDYFNLMGSYMNFAWNKLYRHEFLLQNGLQFEVGLWLIEDCEFISRVLQCQPKFGFIKYAGYHYIQRSESTLSKKFNMQVVELIRRKMSLYNPVLASLGAPAHIINSIYEDMRAYSAVYLMKKMAKSLKKTDFLSQVQVLSKDKLLNPRFISLHNCRNKVEVILIVLAKFKLYKFIYFCINR